MHELADIINKVHCADCLEFMKQMPDECVDLVITDPPYNASNSDLSLPDRNYRTINQDWDKNFDMLPFILGSWRTLNTKGSLLAFCDYHLLGKYLDLSFKQQQILHWNKTNPFPALTKVYPFSMEYIVWFVKGVGYTFNKSYARTDVFRTPILGGKERTTHPTQKPLSIVRNLIQVHTQPGDTIFDPFLGSGTTAVAAKQLGRNFIGVEINPEYCKIAEERLKQEVLPFNQPKPETQSTPDMFEAKP